MDALGSLWRVWKKEEREEDQEVSDFSWFTQVTSTGGDNYIILSPVNTGGQVRLQGGAHEEELMMAATTLKLLAQPCFHPSLFSV